jgi:ADP-heptose:LPS heptosyltransferase
MDTIEPLPGKLEDLLDKNKFRLILHPRSHSSAREWKPDNYRDLIRYLPSGKIQFIITGGGNEREAIDEWHQTLPSHVLNLAGRISLEELISVIAHADGLIAASTGPLHIASALGKKTLGIFPPIRPMDPRRWAPLGSHAQYMVLERKCSDCRGNPSSCHCINEITSEMVREKILQWGF